MVAVRAGGVGVKVLHGRTAETVGLVGVTSETVLTAGVAPVVAEEDASFGAGGARRVDEEEVVGYAGEAVVRQGA